MTHHHFSQSSSPFSEPSYPESGQYSKAVDLVHAFRSRKLSISVYMEKLFLDVEKRNPQLNAVTYLAKTAVLKRAQDLESRDPKPHEFLYGLPIFIKENIQKFEYPLECASKILKGYTSQFDATAICQLEHAGAIIVATCNMDEFAMGTFNKHSCHGPVRNPQNLDCVSGGSSGGSAAACAAGFAPITLGSETGGSVRLPAAFCGIYGLKPSYGRISRYGLVAYGSSLDQISPYGYCAEDLDLVMQAMATHDPKDATTLPEPYVSELHQQWDLSSVRIGIPRSLLQTEGIHPAVLHAFQAFETELKAKGVQIIDVDLPGLDAALAAYYVIACSEASSNLSRYDGIRYGASASSGVVDDLNDLYCKTRSEGFGAEVKMRIMLGTFALSAGYYDAYYAKAQAVRRVIASGFARAFQSVDFVYLPTTPSGPTRLDALDCVDPLQEYLFDMLTLPANLANICAISIPVMDRYEQGMPVGVQLMAGQGQDARLLSFVHALEKAHLTQFYPPQPCP